MKKLLTSILLTIWSAGVWAAGTGPWTLTRAEWSGATKASQVAAITPLREAVQAFDAQPGARLVVVHNGGEDGLFWASDLEGWLVALGVPSARIVDHTGAIKPGLIRLRVEPSAGD